MTYGEWAILLVGIGLVLAVAELLLPTHGILGGLGALSVLAAIVFCFLINAWLGLVAFVGCASATPFLLALAVKLVPRMPLGRQLILPPAEDAVAPMPAQIGQVGVTVSELRPMGVCDFSGQRLEATSELGVIPAGQKVQVVNLRSRQPIVRAV